MKYTNKSGESGKFGEINHEELKKKKTGESRKMEKMKRRETKGKHYEDLNENKTGESGIMW